MEKSEFKKVIALVFIKAFKDFSSAKTKTELADNIVRLPLIKKLSLSRRMLLNYFNYYFGAYAKDINPGEDVIDTLLMYLIFDSQKQFIQNQPSNLDYLNNVPFSLGLEEDTDNTIEELNTSTPNDNTQNSISISGIKSGGNTTITNTSQFNSKIDVKDVESGKDTNIDI